MRRLKQPVVWTAWVLFFGCSREKPDVSVPAATSSSTPLTSTVATTSTSTITKADPLVLPEPVDVLPPQNDVAQHPVLKAIATHYSGFFRADGSWWAPFDCRAPPSDTSRLSAVTSDVAHGRKLYTLQIADFDAYRRETEGKLPNRRSREVGVGPGGYGAMPMAVSVKGTTQVIVKVSYEPTEDRAASKVFGVNPVKIGDKTYYPGRQKDLFVMYRPTPSAGATDAGWLYGTISSDGKTVTSAGLVKSCMRCHERAPHGRLFGIRGSTAGGT